MAYFIQGVKNFKTFMEIIMDESSTCHLPCTQSFQKIKSIRNTNTASKVLSHVCFISFPREHICLHFKWVFNLESPWTTIILTLLVNMLLVHIWSYASLYRKSINLCNCYYINLHWTKKRTPMSAKFLFWKNCSSLIWFRIVSCHGDWMDWFQLIQS